MNLARELGLALDIDDVALTTGAQGRGDTNRLTVLIGGAHGLDHREAIDLTYGCTLGRNQEQAVTVFTQTLFGQVVIAKIQGA